MAQAIINFKTDAKLKNEARKVLNEMGLNFSIAFNAYMKKLTSERKIEFSLPEIPNARTVKAFKDARKEYATGKMKVYTNWEDLEKHLLSLC